MVDTQFERRVRASLALYTAGADPHAALASIAKALRDEEALRNQLSLRLVEVPRELRHQ